MHASDLEFIKYIEYSLGLANSLIGISLFVYTIQTLHHYSDKRLKRLIHKSLYAILFLSFFSLFHFVREIFHLKESFGSIAELPEYFFIFFVYVFLIWGIIAIDAIDAK